MRFLAGKVTDEEMSAKAKRIGDTNLLYRWKAEILAQWPGG